MTIKSISDFIYFMHLKKLVKRKATLAATNGVSCSSKARPLYDAKVAG